jgi:hypothetical protein
MPNVRDYDFKVTVPEGELEGLRVSRFSVGSDDLHAFIFNLKAGSRAITPGDYTRMTSGQTFWMSDTPAEWRDHRRAVHQIFNPATRRVLINGLGIGMVLKAALACDHVEHVDVVELDERVIRLVGPHYTKDSRVTIHHADAVKMTWDRDTRWDVIWNDIWPLITSENLPDMARLHKRYARRSPWIGSWCREECRRQREVEKREDARREVFANILRRRA